MWKVFFSLLVVAFLLAFINSTSYVEAATSDSETTEQREFIKERREEEQKELMRVLHKKAPSPHEEIEKIESEELEKVEEKDVSKEGKIKVKKGVK